jgi:alpha-glucuronidase
MDYSLLWLDWRPKKRLPAYTRCVCGLPATRQGKAALRELISGLQAMGAAPEIRRSPSTGIPAVTLMERPGSDEQVSLRRSGDGIEIAGTGRGLIYGVFHFLRRLSMGEEFPEWTSAPAYAIRMLDHWDNADGSIERGYAGQSFFFRNGKPVCTERTRDYARLMASCGLNGCCINNVNVRGNARKLLTGSYQRELRRIALCFAEYGVSLWLSVSFSAPLELGGLDTADPLDEGVRQWWKETCLRLFTSIPNLAGFLVKADSEGRPGPHSYGRSQAEGANMLADAVRPYGGKILWRCFVYNCTQDWRDTKTDRARAQCDHFAPLDGQFRENVYLQLKNGPVDFQVREPVSPLLGHLERTASLMEFQIAQEYTGQQRHVCYLIPMFREILDFRFHSRPEKDRVSERISAVCAVSNTGDDGNWTGHDLAAANWFGFGLISWNPAADPAEIAREWSILTFGDDPAVTETVTDILLRSREVYEKYTSPLGIGWMCVPGTHYGPSPEGYEFDRWGTYLRANHREIGVERGPEGTGFTEQYSPPLAAMYRDIAACPEELLLFFHRLPYDYRMKDGRTLLQRIYDDHFAGYEEAAAMADAWDKLEGRLDGEVFRRVQERFRMQVRSAAEWRDVVNTWLYRLTMQPDEKGRRIYP